MPTILDPAYELCLEAYTLCYEIEFETFIVYQVDFTAKPKIVGPRMNTFGTPKYYRSREQGIAFEIIRPEWSERPITIRVYTANNYRGQERNIGVCAMPIQDRDLDYTSTHGWLRINGPRERIVFVQKHHDLERVPSQRAFQELYGVVLGYSLVTSIGEIHITKIHPEEGKKLGRIMVQKYLNRPYVDLQLRPTLMVTTSDRRFIRETRIAITRRRPDTETKRWSIFLNEREAALNELEKQEMERLLPPKANRSQPQQEPGTTTPTDANVSQPRSERARITAPTGNEPERTYALRVTVANTGRNEASTSGIRRVEATQAPARKSVNERLFVQDVRILDAVKREEDEKRAVKERERATAEKNAKQEATNETSEKSMDSHGLAIDLREEMEESMDMVIGGVERSEEEMKALAAMYPWSPTVSSGSEFAPEETSSVKDTTALTKEAVKKIGQQVEIANTMKDRIEEFLLGHRAKADEKDKAGTAKEKSMNQQAQEEAAYPSLGDMPQEEQLAMADDIVRGILQDTAPTVKKQHAHNARKVKTENICLRHEDGTLEKLKSINWQKVEVKQTEDEKVHYLYEIAEDEDKDDKIIYQWPKYYERSLSKQVIEETKKEGMVRFRKYKVTRDNKTAKTAVVEYLGIVVWPYKNPLPYSPAALDHLSMPMIREQEVIQYKELNNGRVQLDNLYGKSVIVSTHPELEALHYNVSRDEMEKVCEYLDRLRKEDKNKST